MMRLWLICSSVVCWAAVVSPARCASPTAGGTSLSGTVQLTGRTHERNLSDVVVWLEPLHATETPNLPSRHVQLLQKDKTFQPHTLVIGVGSVVDFPNKDPIFHSAFSTFDGQIFDVGLYPPGTNKSVTFNRPGIVRVFCNIHPSMSAVIVVLDTPYFAKASTNGRYLIANVEPGTYALHAFDERATSGTDSLGAVTVGESAQMNVAPIHLSEVGYLPLPHKNKYGLDYPPSADDTNTYPRIVK